MVRIPASNRRRFLQYLLYFVQCFEWVVFSSVVMDLQEDGSGCEGIQCLESADQDSEVSFLVLLEVG
jgi:hypothetical protein